MWIYSILKCNVFLWCKAEFSKLLHHMIFRNHTNMLILLLKKHLLLSFLKTGVLLNIFLETEYFIIFDQLKYQKNSIY